MSQTLSETKQTIIEKLIEVFDTPYTDDGDPSHKTHFINPAMNTDIQDQYGPMDAAIIVKTARFFGIEIVALCGFKFIPERNPEKYDSCEPCAHAAADIISKDG